MITRERKKRKENKERKKDQQKEKEVRGFVPRS